jgi:hypothetical protein
VLAIVRQPFEVGITHPNQSYESSEQVPQSTALTSVLSPLRLVSVPPLTEDATESRGQFVYLCLLQWGMHVKLHVGYEEEDVATLGAFYFYFF